MHEISKGSAQDLRLKQNSERVVLIVQARMSSSRLPGKVLRKILDKSLLELLVERLRRVKRVDEIVIATSVHPENMAIVKECARLGVKCYRGSEDDVLDRYYQAAKLFEADIVVRVTSDCPFIDPEMMDEMLDAYFKSPGVAFLSNNLEFTYPHGLDIQVIDIDCLERAQRQELDAFEREHVVGHILNNSNPFELKNFENPIDPSGDRALHKLRWTVDYPEDFEFVKRVIETIYPEKKNFGWTDVLKLVRDHPEIQDLNVARRSR